MHTVYCALLFLQHCLFGLPLDGDSSFSIIFNPPKYLSFKQNGTSAEVGSCKDKLLRYERYSVQSEAIAKIMFSIYSNVCTYVHTYIHMYIKLSPRRYYKIIVDFIFKYLIHFAIFLFLKPIYFIGWYHIADVFCTSVNVATFVTCIKSAIETTNSICRK